MKKILITGSDGYIGSTLTQKLIDMGYEVTGLDTFFFSDSILGKYKIPYKIIQADTRNIDGLDLTQFEAIIHLAALSNDPMGEIDPILTEEINHKATINLAKRAKMSKIKRFIFSSSCSIYGITKQDTVDETSEVNPLTSYAKFKIDSENELKKLADDNFCVCLLRNSTVYGFSPKFRDDLVVNNLTCLAVALKKLLIKSDGTPWRPLIDVRDLSYILTEFLTIEKKLVNSQVINIGFNENNLQVKDIIMQIHKLLPDTEVIFNKYPDKDSRSYRVDFSKFNKLFPNIKQEWSIKQSVNDLIFQLQKNNYTKREFLSGKFTRLKRLEKLMKKGRLNKKLYWKF